MTQHILIAGSGFAGMWSALSAARAVSLAGREGDVAVTVVSPSPELHIRPRFYETVFDEMAPDIAPLLAAVGVEHVAGTVDAIDTQAHTIAMSDPRGHSHTLPYDRFVLAVGSRLQLPDVAGVRDHSFNVDQLESAMRLDRHLKSLATQPETPARNTVVVIGGGFTGIETVLEMPRRLRDILGSEATIRVVLLERADTVGPELGAGPRPSIEAAMTDCGIEVMTSAAAAALDANGVTTETGERIDARTVIWTGGPQAHPLAAQIQGKHDRFGRVEADAYLHAVGVDDVFVTGDVARAATDNDGNVALMSCQHALSLGRVSGHNAAAEIVGLPLHRYSQPKYVTCLDLGPWGAVYTEGWDREVHLQGEEAKELKRAINTQWIYPPEADRDAAFAIANPDHVIVP